MSFLAFFTAKSLHATSLNQPEDTEGSLHSQVYILPNELLEKCFGYLDIKSLSQASRVSRPWYSIAQSEHLWQLLATSCPHDTRDPVSQAGYVKNKVIQHQICLQTLRDPRTHEPSDADISYALKFKFIAPIEYLFEKAYNPEIGYAICKFFEKHRFALCAAVPLNEMLFSRAQMYTSPKYEVASLWPMLLSSSISPEKKQPFAMLMD